MAYWGYMEFIKSVLARKKAPRVLEIGVNKGQMFLPLLSHLMANYKHFSLVGIDILKRDVLSVQLQLMSEDLVEGEQDIYFYESLHNVHRLKIHKLLSLLLHQHFLYSMI